MTAIRLPGYSVEENAFYLRAEANYTPERTEKPGEWPDHPQNGVALNYVSDVVTTEGKRLKDGGRMLRVDAKYSPNELLNTLKQGRDRPRQLEQEDSRRANAARRDYREQTQWFEAWAVRECGAKRYSPLSGGSSEYVPA